LPVRTVRSEETGLLGRAREGDVAAFTQLVSEYQHEVYTLAVRLVKDRDLAADVAQESFVRAWRALPKFRGDARFSTWIHRITVNVAWTQRRRAARHDAQPLHELYADPQAGGISPEQAAYGASLRPLLEAALGQLSPHLRAVVVLKDLYDWSHAEIADELGISVTAAKVRLHRARRNLRAMLWEDRDGLLDTEARP
jgi:RNA polymerase sigma-70 factor (ECF subfamily)